ncbi:MBL fold metallo-hydrolase [Xanthomonas campestris pv. campestris]|uniref:ComEC/Rec2 family competence protein n=1 Tax=Xanthomonas campestris TaxID=339 RepID=UPI00236793B6|nr:MBL fold metallo-hydrolase [Xanthomonas campestris]MEA0761500.1 MBL fold metallo-hydrolase [Xanthomonas campestris pv. campestris]MEB1261450.1 MBL fold metallo-hydrolase [Xanthomonas campestris pv. campestris]MEB1323616.1 MBL fold metallo-hydrolase [Xanthomonas campestris pv. campestris]MEB1357278.1 MBL fold metallo-hydrolase [Xanthomonas campestris pv. campestris]MEB1423307.1 MBL fold metallo-hydrolase [Xanthomonas campestris pv. campestris]
MRPVAGCYILDVGHGNATIIEGKKGTVLVDAGQSKIALISFLEAHGVKSLEAVFISHADADHIAGLLAVLSKANTDESFKIGHIYANPDSRDTAAWDDLTEMLDDMESRKLLTYTPNLGVDAPNGSIDLGECSVELIAPSKYMRLRGVGGRHRDWGIQTANSLSAVIYVRYGTSGWIMLPGDLDHIGLQDAVSRTVWHPAPVVIFPHHGGRAGTLLQTQELTAAIMNHTKSNWVLFSGRSQTELFPSRHVVDTLLRFEPTPVMVSIGMSPVLAERIENLKPCSHRNGEGTLFVSPPDVGGSVNVTRYEPISPISSRTH